MQKKSLKNLLTLFLLLVFFTSCKTTSVIITSKSEAEKQGLYKKSENTVAVKPEKKKKKVVEKVEPLSSEVPQKKDITSRLSSNVNYRSGGTTPAGFDCSGLIFYTFNKFDISVPRSSNEMSNMGTVLKPNEIRKGDLIFFKTNGRKIINHVGMVVEVLENEIKFIHSSSSNGVKISSTKDPYYKRTFAQANRVCSSF